jgi:signal peptidase I
MLPGHWLSLVAGPALLPLVVFTLVRSFLMLVTVENRSMSPALEDGDRVLAVRHWPARLLRHGHIVLVQPWGKPPASMGRAEGGLFVKRIVGLPGETLVTSITELDTAHRVRALAMHNSQGQRAWHIPPGHVFVRGDQPLGGFDSLSWGPLPVQSVLGVVVKTLPRQASLIVPKLPRRTRRVTTASALARIQRMPGRVIR